MYEDGYLSNKVNNRDNKLAFWNGGADAGSTLQIYFAKKSESTGISNITVEHAAAVYDLTGRKVAHPTRGVYIRNGKKVIL